jgi:hypothetical protein
MSVPCTKSCWLLGLFAATAAAGVGFALWRHQRLSADATTEQSAFPVPPYSASKYLNTGPDAQYVGIAVCAECHPKKHQSYRLTPHSQALSDLDPKVEPPDGEFFHKASGRSYRVYRRDGQMRHEEVLRTPEGKEIARVDLPVRYLIGSGHFTRSYLVERDGFLYESPITWYSSKKKWDVSPGYDMPRNMSFERLVDTTCLFCHAGRAEAVPDTAQRVRLHEQAIGCESCHGPGSLHEALHRSKKHVPGTEDLTIVNPSMLSRSHLEDICANCHLSGAAMTPLRGRTFTDYRPGMPLTDYRIDYRFDSGSEDMTVVGHIEQLRQSACYKNSEAMTCLTCHDPHAKEKPADSVAFYRQKCLDCHAEKGCKLAKAQRLTKEPQDNCAACHMPRGDTDIPHVAFTHHRIGLHTKQQHTESARVPNLVPTEDISHLPPLDQKRNLGLAYLMAVGNPKHLGQTDVFVERALKLLGEVRVAGLRDAITAEAIAEVHFQDKKDLLSSIVLAREAIEGKDASPEVRAAALYLLAVGDMQESDFASAGQRLEEATRMRRTANDWWRLAGCRLEQGRSDWALSALEKALTIQPYRADLHFELARLYDSLGSRKRAAEHRDRAQWLAQDNRN